MRQILTLLLVCFLHSAWAATYYFSTLSGDDSRTSAEAKNPATPWKTISKLNTFFSNLQPGDQVLFKRNETFYGSITVNKSGTSGSPIVIGAYGTGNKPVITSLVTLSGWTANSTYKGVYECSANSAFGAQVNIVLLNDVQKAIGRYPNSDASNSGYLTLESHSGKTSITDNELTSAINWKGAELVLKTSHWTIERCKISSHSGSTIYYTANEGGYEPRNDYGYFIQTDIRTLDRLGEWYYNPSTKKISMFFGSNSPSSYTIKASTFSNLVYSYSKSYVVFDNLTLKGANEKGICIYGGSGVSVKNCDILFSGTDGVKASGTNFKLENSQVVNSNNNGISVSGGTNPQVRNNFIKNSYIIPGMGQSGNGQGAGIRISSTGIAEYNNVINSGFIGIAYSGSNLLIKNNFIDSFCYIKDDAGGIYTSNGMDYTIKGVKIIGNILSNGIGAPGGTNTQNSSADGIYMDDNVNGTEITGNTIANCNRGIYLHNTRYIVVRNNTIFNNKNGQLQMKYDGIGGLVRNHTVTNNIFFSKYAADAATTILTKKDDNDIALFGRLDSNYYARPADNTNLILTATYLWTSNMVKTNRDLSEWKSKYNKDKVSKLCVKTFTGNPDDNIRYVFNATQQNITVSLNGSYVDAKNIKYSNSITLAPYTSAVLIKDGAGTVTENKSPTVSITTPATNTSYTSTATINITAAAADEDGTINKVEFYNGTKLLYTDYSGTYSYSWTNVPSGTYSLTAKATDNDGSVTTSAVVKVSVGTSTGNTAPTVSITTPVTNTSYSAQSTINMIAKATDADGTISKVEFYNGTKLLHTEYNGTYSYSWANVPSGTYSLTAKATDNDGAVTTSAIVKVSVGSSTGNTAPTVSITTPVTNTSYTAGATINMLAKATDADGTINKVEFYNGTKLLYTDYSGTYSYSWTNVPSGTYSLTAKATDNDGAVTASAVVKVSVGTSTGNTAPTVSITTPVTNTSYSAQSTINMIAKATDADGTISKVEFYNGTKLLHTEYYGTYSYSWTNVPSGTYSLTAKATDNDGTVTTSAIVKVSVGSSTGNTPPTVSITTPVTNTSYTAAATINMLAKATDADGTISRVEFYNGSKWLHTEYQGTYSYSWSNVPAGTYTITAKATDNDGATTTSAAVKVTVVSKSLRSSDNNNSSVVINNIDTAKSEVAIADKASLTNLDFKLFPNPAVNSIYLNFDGYLSNQKATVTIQNMSGSILKRFPAVISGKSLEVNISSLNTGMFIISLSAEKYSVNKRFLKIN